MPVRQGRGIVRCGRATAAQAVGKRRVDKGIIDVSLRCDWYDQCRGRQQDQAQRWPNVRLRPTDQLSLRQQRPIDQTQITEHEQLEAEQRRCRGRFCKADQQPRENTASVPRSAAAKLRSRDGGCGPRDQRESFAARTNPRATAMLVIVAPELSTPAACKSSPASDSTDFPLNSLAEFVVVANVADVLVGIVAGGSPGRRRAPSGSNFTNASVGLDSRSCCRPPATCSTNLPCRAPGHEREPRTDRRRRVRLPPHREQRRHRPPSAGAGNFPTTR